MSPSPGELANNPSTPFGMVHEALQDAFETHADWSRSTPSTLAAFSGIIDLAERSDAVDEIIKVVGRAAEDSAQRERLLPPGRGWLLGCYEEDVQHLLGYTEMATAPGTTGTVLLHLQRVNPHFMQFRVGSEIPLTAEDALDRYCQASELITIFPQDGTAANILLLPSDDLSEACVEAFGFSLDIAALGWDEEAQLTKTTKELAEIRDKVEAQTHAYVRTFPQYWTRFPDQGAPFLVDSIQALRPVEY